jgi:2-polyprenyl-3-methyl-5-hydroxy-6-metoxy-1,4-benzoquinol methylase
MSIKNCRVCGHVFFNKPILVYQKMPFGAQNLPSKNDLKNDKGIDMNVCQCSGCGLVQLDNDPVPYYKEVIRATAFSEEMKNFRIEQFKNFVKKYSLNGKKIIEIGCGKGEYLNLMQKNKLDVFGLEYADKSVKQCVDNGLKVFQGYIEDEDYKIRKAPYNAFFILNFLEHLPNINSVLSGVYNNLSDDAVGIVEVPNFDMILKKNLFFEFIRDHLFYFTKDTLETVLKLNGFEIIECEVVWHEYIISAVVRKRKKILLEHFYRRQKSLKTEISEYIGKYKNKKVAVWGAGHEALAVISMMNLFDKIRYVVDSAIFKQGKYTPVTHVPIVSPATLNVDPIDAIIVMAASYSDEVVKTLREKYNKNINICILRDFGLEIIN